METAEKKRTLSDIVNDVLAAAWLLDEAEGELSPELEAELDALSVELPEKVDRLLGAVDGLKAKADVYAARAKSLNAAAKRLRGDAARLQDYCRLCLEGAKITKLETENYPSVTIRKNPPRVEIADEVEFLLHYADTEFVKSVTTHKIDKAEAKRVLKAGGGLHGAEFVQTTSLRY